MSAADIIVLRNIERDAKVYEQLLLSKSESKKVRRGGCDVRFITEDKSKAELVTTYSFKKGMLGKEKTVVVTLPLQREAGAYTGRIGESYFRIIVDKKGSYEEEWGGSLEEAKKEIPDITEAYLEDVGDLRARLGAS